MEEKLTFVDENDKPIGESTRHEAWEHGYYTRNIRVVVRDEHGRFLSQRRSLSKASYPGMWTVAASGHVDAGEDWDTAAARETKEEINVSTTVTFVGSFTLVDDVDDKKIRQIIHVYETTISSSTKFHLEAGEVDEIRWFKLDELKNQMQNTPTIFTPSLHELITRFY